MPRKPVIASLRVPVRSRPADAAASRLKQARELEKAGQLPQALLLLEQALAAAPKDATVLSRLGETLLALGRLPDALSRFDSALALDPTRAMVWNNRGATLLAMAQTGEALKSFDHALRLQPDVADIWLNHGNALQSLRRYDAAATSYREALRLRPTFAEAYYRLAMALHALKRSEDALREADHALTLQPDHAAALQLHGALCRVLRQPEKALRSFEKLIALKPGSADAHNNRGVILQELGRVDEAIAAYGQAVALQPDHADALRNRALALLLAGEFSEGWVLHEHRWQAHAPRPATGTPEWNGRAVEGSLLILPEQGIGDQLFFSGMLPDAIQAAGAAASVTLQVDRRLQPLLRRSFAGTGLRVVASDKPRPTHNVHVFLGSLGRYFRGSMDATRASRSAWLKASPERSHAYRQSLREPGTLLCGLSWLSRNGEFGEDKSLSLSPLASLLTLPGTRWLNLQYGDTASECRQLRDQTGIELLTPSGLDVHDDLDGLAAAICACDMVVTVSNTTAHLAAGLGLPTMVMLPQARGLLWYWHRDRKDSPWYPSARLFRQPANGDWQSVVDTVRQYLACRIGNTGNE